MCESCWSASWLGRRVVTQTLCYQLKVLFPKATTTDHTHVILTQELFNAIHIHAFMADLHDLNKLLLLICTLLP